MAVSQLDTPIIKLPTEGDALTIDVNVNYLHWVSKSAIAGDDLLVSDGDGNTVWEEVADAANYSKIHVIKNRISNLTLTTKDSGTLYVVRNPERPAHAW